MSVQGLQNLGAQRQTHSRTTVCVFRDAALFSIVVEFQFIMQVPHIELMVPVCFGEGRVYLIPIIDKQTLFSLHKYLFNCSWIYCIIHAPSFRPYPESFSAFLLSQQMPKLIFSPNIVLVIFLSFFTFHIYTSDRSAFKPHVSHFIPCTFPESCTRRSEGSLTSSCLKNGTTL